MDLMSLRRNMMGVIAGMAGSSYTLLHSEDLTISYDGTSIQNAATITIGSTAYTSSKIIFVEIRDKSGPRSGYFYGTDNIIMNDQPAKNSTGYARQVGKFVYTCDNGQVSVENTAYGLYVYEINSDGGIVIRVRYSASSSMTIDSTYSIKVYSFDWPNNDSPFDD